ncbi:MAG: hypothetical protein KDA92_16360, partial [Planctomycetales bacterium]|nr:hypothetical protein [Planctomycetales bacterium]
LLTGQSQRRGGSWQVSEFSGDADGVTRIAVGCGAVQKRALENKGVDYWALGGEERHHVLLSGKSTAAYAGSPQGRSPQDLDAHGALLVEVQYGQAKTRLLETDLYRWRREKIVATEVDSVDAVIGLINRNLTQIPGDASRFSWLLDWNIICQGRLAQTLLTTEVQERILRAVNQTTANDTRWSLSVNVEPVSPAAELLEEDTILGDFLRCVQRFEHSTDAWHELVPYLPESDARDSLIAEMQHGTEAHCQQLWRRVAAFGADLLRGEVAVEQSSAARVR